MPLFKRNTFGQLIFVKKIIIRLFGTIVYGRFNWVHTPKITGAEQFQYLPDENVLIVSNHQNYEVRFFTKTVGTIWRSDGE